MRFAVTLLALLLIGVIGASAYLLLQSCGLRLPFTDRVLSVCETAEELKTREDLAAALDDSRALEDRIAWLERRLAAVPCKATPPDPPPPPPEPKPEPKPESTPSGLAPDAFDRDDISVMEGCWQLSTVYDVRDIRTGAITKFRHWQICFDRNGKGREVMRATNGTRCEGTLTGRLSSGKLTMREPGNLRCDNNSYIYRRDITCSLDAAGRAQCNTYQPETRGRGRATLRRARR